MSRVFYQVGNAMYTSSMELNLDLQRSLTTCYSTVTFSYFFRLLKLLVFEEVLFWTVVWWHWEALRKKTVTLPGSVLIYKDAVSTAGTI